MIEGCYRLLFAYQHSSACGGLSHRVFPVSPILGLRILLGEMGKVALIGIAAKINIIVLRYLASSLDDGAMTQYWNATRLVDFAQGIIAVGIASVLLPKIIKAVENNDGESLSREFRWSI